MIFQHTHELVMSGAKVQTRRIVKPGDNWIMKIPIGMAVVTISGTHNPNEPRGNTEALAEGRVSAVYYSERLKYRQGSTYAVQPGRGKKAVGRIRITGIRREDVRRISDADVLAEGFRSFAEFIRVWAKMHSPHDIIYWTSSCGQEYWQSCTRNSDPAKYSAWVIEFELEPG